MKLLIGSGALFFAGEEYLCPKVERTKKTCDIDWIGHYEDFEKQKKLVKPKRIVPMNRGNKVVLFGDKIHEFEIAWREDGDGVCKQLLEIAKNDLTVAFKHPSSDFYIATPDLIFTLKKSHRYLKDSPHFLKTMHDFRYLRDKGCQVPESLKEWYKLRVKQTYWYKHPRLKDMDKKSFFKDDNIPYKYDHDTLHLAVMHLDQPAYNYFKPNTAEVECSREMFEKSSEEVKLYSVLEEAYVLALERSQIPTNGTVAPKRSFDIALMKVCSSITSGWWREYAYENYFKVQDMYSESYVARFHSALKTGIVKELDHGCK
ncbi:MAG TPA: hypothetical protein VKN14_05585 [Flavobacteriaceae bacterium]|nr:hypothetical protein [Flavobacteriaceae bacterium]